MNLLLHIKCKPIIITKNRLYHIVTLFGIAHNKVAGIIQAQE